MKLTIKKKNDFFYMNIPFTIFKINDINDGDVNKNPDCINKFWTSIGSILKRRCIPTNVISGEQGVG